MDLSRPTRRSPRENIVPMINVVFLLLIFFLMTAQLAPPEPFEVDPPDSSSQEPAEGKSILYMNAEGELAMGDARGEAVFGLIAELGVEDTLLVRADQEVEAVKVAALLTRLGTTGLGGVHLVSEGK